MARGIEWYLEKVGEQGLPLADPRPLAEWAMKARAGNHGKGGVIVAEDGSLVAEVRWAEGTATSPGGAYVSRLLVDVDPLGVARTEVGLAVGRLARALGQPVAYVRYHDVATGHTRSSLREAHEQSARADARQRGQWTVADVASELGVAPSTVRAYVARGQMPEPDGRMGGVMWWWPETVTAWQESRRGQGWRRATDGDA